MDRNVYYMFDCWADPVVHHLILLKSSMVKPIKVLFFSIGSEAVG